jgi:hypothetical protein
MARLPVGVYIARGRRMRKSEKSGGLVGFF